MDHAALGAHTRDCSQQGQIIAAIRPSRWQATVVEALAVGVLAVALAGAPDAALALEEGDVELAPPVLDQARVLSPKRAGNLAKKLDAFEEETGFRILVLTEDPQVAVSKSPRELKQIWGLPDPDAVLVLVRPLAGNILAFNYGENIKRKLPDRFFGEMQGRLGNKYSVADDGADGVVQETIDVLQTCLRKEKGCYVVPGIGKDQYTATLASSVAGGVFFGFSALTSAQFMAKNAKGEDAIFKFAPLLLSPLWGLFFVGLGLNPLLQREAATQLLLQNIGAFSATAAATAAIWPRMMGMWSGFL